MTIEINNFIGKPRDTKREQKLIKQLRDLPEIDAQDFVNRILEHDPFLGLFFAKRVLKEKKFFVGLLGKAVKEADASEIKYWLECCVAKLGFRRVVSLLKNHFLKYPIGVDKALYWLQTLLPKSEPKSVKMLEELKILVSTRAKS